ncbi:putative primosome PriB/single-strand DNA-binding, nucleic acid-binding protein [Helianthus annuus]|nr:putative primosome PriB/single-strand DNA-binding, nucleic acid-binding protein [Helianthus annuus]
MVATGCRLRPLLRRLLSSQRFSSSSVDNPATTGSVVYRHTLRTQRPTTIQWQKDLQNSATFIGTLISPLKTVTTCHGVLGVHTQLKVDPPSGSKRFLRIYLDMWDDMAELATQHLKPNDYIYVSGYLQSFTKALDNGNIIMYPKVLVKEINFVANSNQRRNNIDDGESTLEKRRKRLHLWQVFFANPYEWQDLRKRKVNPSQPDFRHKGSGEALWLKPNDPPWVTRQLQLQDSRMGDIGLRSSRTLSSFQL